MEAEKFLNGSTEICEEDLRLETNGKQSTTPIANTIPTGHTKGMGSMNSQNGNILIAATTSG